MLYKIDLYDSKDYQTIEIVYIYTTKKNIEKEIENILIEKARDYNKLFLTWNEKEIPINEREDRNTILFADKEVVNEVYIVK